MKYSLYNKRDQLTFYKLLFGSEGKDFEHFLSTYRLKYSLKDLKKYYSFIEEAFGGYEFEETGDFDELRLFCNVLLIRSKEVLARAT